MRRLSILTFCLVFAACAGTRTIDGETTKNWVKIVSSRVDNTGTVKDVCYVLDLSFYPGSAYDRLKNNPSTCLEQCCWYSEQKNVDFYFNDGFTKDLEDEGISRRYYPDHIKIKMNYSSILNRLSAKASDREAISKNGVIVLEYDEVKSVDKMLNKGFDEVKEKVFSEEDSSRLSTQKNAYKEPAAYKTTSISGLNRAELLAKAQEEKDKAHAENIAALYSNVSKGETVTKDMPSDIQISPFVKPAKQPKTVSSTLENKTQTQEKVQQNAEAKPKVIYDVQKPAAQETKIEEPALKQAETQLDAVTLKQKLAYERKQAVNLLKRFYGKEIDAYLRFLDKAKRQEGQVLLTGDKVWQAKKIGTPVYKIDCNVKGKIALLGTDAGTETTEYPIACGTYIVDLDEKTVEAKDTLAKKIAQKKY